MKRAVLNTLHTVRDEQLYVTDANVVDLGLVYDNRSQHGTVRVL
jgi:metal-sulfur cluster biosynthetic enzyme